MDKLWVKEEKGENIVKTAIVEPVGLDLFLGGIGGTLSQEVISNQEFQKGAAERREMYENLASIFKKIGNPEKDISTALKEGLVSIDETKDVYSKLSQFLEADENNARLILYLPFSLFPLRVGRKDTLGELSEVQEDFYKTVKSAWLKLLDESDVRASFVDGDVLEPEMGEPIRIRKAGHLIPFLIPAGVVSEDEIKKLIESADTDGDVELSDSLNDGLSAWEDKKADTKRVENHDYDDILNSLSEELDTIDKQLTGDSDYVKRVSVKRVIWERNERRGMAIRSTARELAFLVGAGEIDLNHLKKSGLPETEQRTLTMNTMLIAIEHNWIGRREVDRSKVFKLERLCKDWEQTTDSELLDEIDCVFAHLKRLGLLDSEVDKQYFVSAPDLTLPMPVEGKILVVEAYQALLEAVNIIKADPELRTVICPFFIGIGSRVKGIAGKKSDKDATLFWRPGATLEDREKVLGVLKEKCPRLTEIDAMPEVWLDEVGGKISFKKEVETRPNSVSPQQIHFIFGGVWMGDEVEIRRVTGDLANSYLDLSRFGVDKGRARQHLLRRLEMDTLMYRLMHKGFKRTYPQRNDKKQMSQIDYGSDFYEPEYRQIASLLFLSRVFLPDLDLAIKKAPTIVSAK